MQVMFVCFVVGALLSVLYVWRAGTPANKLRRHRRAAVVSGALFFLFVCSTVAAGERWSTVAIVGPAIFGVTWASVRLTHVCPRCGGLLFWPLGSRWMRVCPYCRQPLPSHEQPTA